MSSCLNRYSKQARSPMNSPAVRLRDWGLAKQPPQSCRWPMSAPGPDLSRQSTKSCFLLKVTPFL